MHSKFLFISLATLALYILTLCTVTYVGVYLSYIAIPIIIIFGVLALMTKPKNGTLEAIIQATNNEMKELNSSINNLNEKAYINQLKKDSSTNEREQIRNLEYEIKLRKIYLKNAEPNSEKWKLLSSEIQNLTSDKKALKNVIQEMDIKCEADYYSNKGKG